MPKSIVKNILFAFVLLAHISTRAIACSFPIIPIEQQIDDADEIFIATLMEAKVRPADDHQKWPGIEGRFQVEKILKGGTQPKEVTLTTGMGRGDCGIGMMVSANYIIFKQKKETGIGVGNGTQIIEDFQRDEFAKKIQSAIHRQRSALRKN